MLMCFWYIYIRRLWKEILLSNWVSKSINLSLFDVSLECLCWAFGKGRAFARSKNSLNASAFLLSFEPEWLVGNVVFCCFIKKSVCVFIFVLPLLFFNYIFLTVVIVSLCQQSSTWSAYKFQTWAWKLFFVLFLWHY